MEVIKKARILWYICCFLIAGLLAPSAFGQNQGSVAATVLQSSSAIAGKRVSTPTAPSPSATASAIVPPVPVQEPIPGAAKIKFVLKKVTIKGNTVYSTQELIQFATPYLNKEISVADLQVITQEISDKYRNDGYILSHAVLPAQDIRGGEAKIQILEGFISKVTIAGNPGGANKLLQTYGRYITQSRPLKLKVLERFMLLANDIPGEDVKAVITPSKTIPNAAELTLVSQHKLITTFATFDNFGTTFLGPQQITANLTANSLFMPGDRTAITGVMTPDPRQMKFIELVHAEPLNTNGLSLLVGGNYVETNPQEIISPLFINGYTYTFFSTLSDALIRSRAKNLNIYLTGTYQTTVSTILNTPLFTDRIRGLTGGIYFDLTDSWRGFNAINLNATKGFNIFGASNDGFLSRSGGRSDFLKLNGDISRTQYLWRNFSVFVGGQGQYAFQPLLAGEQFYFGGPLYGRAYEPAIILGDSGVAGKAELRLDSSLNPLALRNVQYYVFYDAGIVWNRNTPGIATHGAASCFGGGVRFAFNKVFSGNVYVGVPVDTPAPNAVATGLNVTSTRAFFQIRADLP